MTSVEHERVTATSPANGVTPGDRECPVCSGDLPIGRSDRRYCSNACRQRAYRMVRAVDAAGGLVGYWNGAVTAVAEEEV